MIKKVLLASDGSENALRAAAFTAGLSAQIQQLEVTVLSVNEILDKMKYYSPLNTPVIFEEVEIFFKEKVREAVDTTAAALDKNKCTINTKTKVGNPAQTIIDYASEGNFDLIVIGSRGLGSLKGVLMGSVSIKVVQMSGCPVAVVK